MPKSSNSGKRWIKNTVLEIFNKPMKILDVGCGRGTYKRLFKDIPFMYQSNWTGVEVWEPYIELFSLKSVYNTILNEDARKLNWNKLGIWDLVFMGDVLEHMTKQEAQHLVDQCLPNTKYIVISIPIVHMSQGAEHGNPYEIHVKPDWTDQEVLESFPNIIKHHKEGKIGVYLLKGSL